MCATNDSESDENEKSLKKTSFNNAQDGNLLLIQGNMETKECVYACWEDECQQVSKAWGEREVGVSVYVSGLFRSDYTPLTLSGFTH